MNENDVKELLTTIQKLPEKISNYDLIKCVTTGNLYDIDVNIDENIKEIFNTETYNLPLPENLNANLREYQHVGYKWLAQNIQFGFGSILADDMGLGKTIQTLTLILKLKEDKLLKKEKVLIVAPTGLLINWQREINKFTPNLSSIIYHGPDRTIEMITLMY